MHQKICEVRIFLIFYLYYPNMWQISDFMPPENKMPVNRNFENFCKNLILIIIFVLLIKI